MMRVKTKYFVFVFFHVQKKNRVHLAPFTDRYVTLKGSMITLPLKRKERKKNNRN